MIQGCYVDYMTRLADVQCARTPALRHDAGGPIHNDVATNAPNEFLGQRPPPGEWLCYAFLPVTVSNSPALQRLLAKVRKRLEKYTPQDSHLEWLPGRHSAQDPSAARGSSDSDQEDAESNDVIHISLTRPILVRARERDTFFREVRSTLQSFPPLSLSFSRFSTLPSSSSVAKNRDFFVLEVGKGHEAMVEMSEALSGMLRSFFRAQGYWSRDQVRFHTSFAFLDAGQSSGAGVDRAEGGTRSPSRLAQDLAQRLEERYAEELRRSVGELRVSTVGIKVGGRTQWVRLEGRAA